MVRRSTWIVLGIFALLVGFTLLYQRYQVNKTDITATATPTIPPEYLYSLGDTQLNDIKIADNTGKSIDLYRDPVSASWAIAGVPADQADTAQIDSVSTQLVSLQIEDTLTHTISLAAIGLETPAYTITLTTSAGSTMVTYVGIQTAIGSGYYVRNDSGKLLIVGKTAIDDIINLLQNPPLLLTATPEVTPTETIAPILPVGQETPTP